MVAGHRCEAVHQGLDGYDIISDYAIVESSVERPDGYRRMHKKHGNATQVRSTYDKKVDLPTSGSPRRSTVISGAMGLYSIVCSRCPQGRCETSRRLHIYFFGFGERGAL